MERKERILARLVERAGRTIGEAKKTNLNAIPEDAYWKYMDEWMNSFASDYESLSSLKRSKSAIKRDLKGELVSKYRGKKWDDKIFNSVWRNYDWDSVEDQIGDDGGW